MDQTRISAFIPASSQGSTEAARPASAQRGRDACDVREFATSASASQDSVSHPVPGPPKKRAISPRPARVESIAARMPPALQMAPAADAHAAPLQIGQAQRPGAFKRQCLEREVQGPAADGLEQQQADLAAGRAQLAVEQAKLKDGQDSLAQRKKAAIVNNRMLVASQEALRRERDDTAAARAACQKVLTLDASRRAEIAALKQDVETNKARQQQLAQLLHEAEDNVNLLPVAKHYVDQLTADRAHQVKARAALQARCDSLQGEAARAQETLATQASRLQAAYMLVHDTQEEWLWLLPRVPVHEREPALQRRVFQLLSPEMQARARALLSAPEPRAPKPSPPEDDLLIGLDFLL